SRIASITVTSPGAVSTVSQATRMVGSAAGWSAGAGRGGPDSPGPGGGGWSGPASATRAGPPGPGPCGGRPARDGGARAPSGAPARVATFFAATAGAFVPPSPGSAG